MCRQRSSIWPIDKPNIGIIKRNLPVACCGPRMTMVIYTATYTSSKVIKMDTQSQITANNCVRSTRSTYSTRPTIIQRHYASKARHPVRRWFYVDKHTMISIRPGTRNVNQPSPTRPTGDAQPPRNQPTIERTRPINRLCGVDHPIVARGCYHAELSESWKMASTLMCPFAPVPPSWLQTTRNDSIAFRSSVTKKVDASFQITSDESF